MVAACIVIGSSMVTAAQAAIPKNVLVIGKAADPQTLDPAVTIDNNDWTVTYPAYQRLIRYKTVNGQGSTEIEGDLAKSWSHSDDGLVWTFDLKSDQHFSDGSTVSAQDVVWSFQRLMKIGQGPSGAYPQDMQVSALNAHQVEFRLKRPFAPFLNTLANDGASILNADELKQHAENQGKTWLATHTAGSGPYQLVAWQKGQQLVMQPNPYYAGKKPQFKRVVVKIIGESSTRRLQLERGDLDIAESLPVDQLKALANKPDISVKEYPSLRVTYLYLNNALAPLDQVGLRRAISYAVDYQGIIKGTLDGAGKQMQGPIPQGLWGHDDQAMQYHYDLNKAKAELAKLSTKPRALTFLYSDKDPNWEPVALSVQANLKQLGIQVHLEKLANATMRARIDKGNFDISIGNWSPDFADPYMFMNYWFDSANKGLAGNRSFFSDPKVDQLLKEAAQNSDQQQRVKLYQQVQKIVIDDAAYAYLFQKNYQVAMRSNVKGFAFNPMLEQVFNLSSITKQ
ncbi:ABC transporter substrate-binding protein [Celerinatantimonas sp. YJH-8]